MSSLADLVRDRTSLSAGEVAHLQRLVAAWGLASDLCFADLLLFVPVGDGRAAATGSGATLAAGGDICPAPRSAAHPTGRAASGRRGAARADTGRAEAGRAGGGRASDRLESRTDRYVIVGQVRPATSQTLYPHDLLGTVVSAEERPTTHRSFRSGEICEGGSAREGLTEQVHVLAIPVRFGGRVVAVVSRESAPSVGRRHGELEKAYLSVFDRIARMVTLGEFPFPEQETSGKELPRVGDGAVLLDRGGCIEYSSPNANSALHRLGVLSDVGGRRLAELGIDEAVWRQAVQSLLPATAELTAAGNTHVLVHAIPLLERRQVVGGLLLLRDVSELRRLDRLLVSKDTHIREIHHRVKNNLQTISSLLRIQARRLQAPEARQAIDESVRRIGSIALVHETLSREAAEDVPFAEIARPLVRMVEESLVSADVPVSFRLAGDDITLPAAVATPLALVISELLQNAMDHAFGEGPPAGGAEVQIELARDEDGLRVTVVDNGTGLPPGFEPERTTGLGLSIVRTLVQSELGGSIVMHDRAAEGGRGTLVELHIPPGEGGWSGTAAGQTA